MKALLPAFLLGATSLLNGGSQWLSVVIVARALGVEATANYAIVLTVVAPLVTFFSMGLRVAYVTRADSRSFSAYFRLRLGGTATVAVLAPAACFYLDIPLGFSALVILAKCLDMLADILFAPLQRQGKVTQIAAWQALNGTLSPVLMVVLFLASDSGLMLFVGYLGGSILAFSYTVWTARKAATAQGRVLRTRENSADSTNVYYYTHIALPLAVAASAVSLGYGVPRFLLDRHGTHVEVAAFASASYLTLVGTAFVSALAQHILPRVVTAVGIGDLKGFGRLARSWALSWTVVGCCAMLFAFLYGDSVLVLVYGPQFAIGKSLIVLILAWTVLSVSWFLDLVISAVNRYITLAIIASSALGISLVFSAVFFDGSLMSASVVSLVHAVGLLVGRLLAVVHLRSLIIGKGQPGSSST